VTAPAVLELAAVRARRRVGAIRDALAVADDLLAQAFADRDWEALGHADWPAYCAAELPELRHLKLRAAPRRERAAALHALGASVRDIAAATGASVGTAHNDVATITAGPGSTSAGVAPGSPPAPLTARIVGLLAEAGPLDVLTVARRLRVRQAQVSPALSRLAAAGRIVYLRPARRGQLGTYTVQGDVS
jgi:hypothetical protein